MFKNFRTLIVSAMLVMLFTVPAFPDQIISPTNISGDWGWFKSADRTLIISKDGAYSFGDFGGIVSLDKVDLTGNASYDVRDVTINIPAQSGVLGMAGSWVIVFPENVKSSDGKIVSVDVNNRVKLTIAGSGTSAILVDESKTFSWDVGKGQDLIINAPIRGGKTGDTTGNINLTLTVEDGGTAEFGSNASVYALQGYSTTETGYSAGTAKYTVKAGGLLTVRNQWALRGAGLTVTTEEGTGTATAKSADVVIDLSALDLRGKTASGTDGGATLTLPTGFNLPQNTTLFGGATLGSTTFRKRGNGTLAIAARSDVLNNVETIKVEEGRLEFNAKQTFTSGKEGASWVTSGDNPTIDISKNATFKASTGSIRHKASGTLSFIVKGKAEFDTHAVINRADSSAVTEIYPYEDYSNTANVMNIGAENVSLTANGNVAINGFLAVKELKGDGTITITGTGDDNAGLILTNPDEANYMDFKGKIKGTKANVGLYVSSDTAAPFTRNLFRSADVVQADNLIVYGPAQLTVDDGTIGKLGGVGSIYLRSNRPGAKNFVNGQRNEKVANADLTIGKLLFAKGEKSADVKFDGIKVDATSSPANMGLIKVSGDSAEVGINVFLNNIQLYANRGAGKDFERYAAPFTSIHALSLDSSVPRSRIIIDGVTGDGYVVDVITNNIYAVQIAGGSDVKFTGSGTFAPLANNNSLLVKSGAKLEIEKGGTINGNLKFEGGTSDDNATDNAFVSDKGWYSRDLDGYTTFSTHVGSGNRRINNNGDYAVKVTGNIVSTPAVVIRTKPDSTAFDDYDSSTTGQRFKVLGVTGTDSTYTNAHFKASSNDVFGFTIPSANTSALEDEKGIIVEVGSNNELAIINLGEYSFISDGNAFGNGDGSEFSIRIPFTVTVRGEEAQIFEELDQNRNKHYYLQVGSSKWYFKAYPYFLQYQDSEYLSRKYIEQIFDPSSIVKVENDDIVAGIRFMYENEAAFLNVFGNSYSGKTSVNVPVALYLENESSDQVINTIQWIHAALPGFKEYPFTRSGVNPTTGEQRSKGKVTPIGDTTREDGSFTELSFTVEGLSSTSAASSMLDSAGTSTPVKDLTLVRSTNGTRDKTYKYGSGWTISGTTVTVPSSIVEGTGGKTSAARGFSLRGTRTTGSGEIITDEAKFTIRTHVSPSDTTNVTSKTVEGGTGSNAVFTQNVDLTGTVSYVDYDMPAGVTRTKLDDGFGITVDTDKVAPRTYKFSVLAYSGTDSSTSDKRLYNFTVTVDPPATFVLTLSKTSSSILLTSRDTVTLSSNAKGTASYDRTVSPATGLTVTLSGTAATISPDKPGNYTVTFSARDSGRTSGDTATRQMTVTVTAPASAPQPLSIDVPPTLSITLPASASVRITKRNASGDVSYTVSPSSVTSWIRVSSDVAYFTPTTAGSYDVTITATDNARQTATARMRVTVVSADTPFALRAESTDITITMPNAGTAVLIPTAARGTVIYKASVSPSTGLNVSFNENTAVFVPTASGKYTVAVTATDTGRNANNTATATIQVTVKRAQSPSPEVFTLSAGSPTIDIILPNASSTTLTPQNALGAVSYTANYDWVTFSGSRADFAPEMTGTFTVIITATDAGRTTANTATATVVVTVTEGQAPAPRVFSLTAGSRSLVIALGNESTMTLTPYNAQGTVSYTANYRWVTFEDDTATFKPTEAGSFDVVITATDAGRTTGNTAAATVRVIVTSSEPESEPLSLNAPNTASVSLDVSSRITLTTDNALGTLSYSCTVSPSTGLTVTFSGNTANFSATRPGTYTVTITVTDAGRTTDNTATTRVTVTVPERPGTSGGNGSRDVPGGTDSRDVPHVIVSPDVSGDVGSSGGGGGCDSGFGVLGLAVLGLLMRRRNAR